MLYVPMMSPKLVMYVRIVTWLFGIATFSHITDTKDEVIEGKREQRKEGRKEGREGKKEWEEARNERRKERKKGLCRGDNHED